jgi:hypothetical protein
MTHFCKRLLLILHKYNQILTAKLVVPLSQKVNCTIYAILSFKVVGAGHARENMEQVIVVAGMARLLVRREAGAIREVKVLFREMLAPGSQR